MSRLLLVEDDADLRRVLEAALREAGHAVEAVANGRAALAAFEREPPDLLLLDLLMPEMDGFSLMAALYRKGLRDKSRVLLLSAAGRAEEGANWVKADGYLEKPFSIGQLLQQVSRLLGRG